LHKSAATNVQRTGATATAAGLQHGPQSVEAAAAATMAAVLAVFPIGASPDDLAVIP